MRLRIIGTVKSIAISQEFVDRVGQIKIDLESKLTTLDSLVERWQLKQPNKMINGINLLGRASSRLKLTVEDVKKAEQDLRGRIVDIAPQDLGS
jgi:broad specificity polyphosphatase/5'/3'-nucleotidase SurE